MSGYTFWSHDIGGFAVRTPEDLYRRWLPFGMLGSHSRAHGMPPKEPSEYGEPFMVVFATSAKSARGLVCLPSDNVLHQITLPRGKGGYRLAANPLAGRSTLTVRMYNAPGK